MSDSCSPMDCSPPSSSVHGIFQGRILEWVAISFPEYLPGSGIKLVSPTLLADSLQLSHQGSTSSQTRVEPRSPALQADSLPSEPQGSSGTLEWVACPFPRGSPQPRNRTGVSSFAGRLLTSWATGEVLRNWYWLLITHYHAYGLDSVINKYFLSPHYVLGFGNTIGNNHGSSPAHTQK